MGELGERCGGSHFGTDVDSEFVVAAAQVMQEGAPGGQELCGSDPFGGRAWVSAALELREIASRWSSAAGSRKITMAHEPLSCINAGGRYWDRTSDLFRVNERSAPPLTCDFVLTSESIGAVECG